MKDELFKQDLKKQFEFDKNVASVFDDMINRSVPFYKENLELCANLIAKIISKEAIICDLGCSSANFLIFLANLRKDFKLFGVDNSPSMLDIARSKIKAYGLDVKFFEANLCEFDFFKSDVFVANYTLQFIRPPKRQELVNTIYKNLNENGVFIISEKILYEDAFLSKNIIELYADYKQKQGYSKFEIAAKREALENVLIPYSENENFTMFKNAGFKKVESIFKWANFESFIAFK
ncbi:carboxy-S-adenosyl-L-methionine synthase CmoA [Campylobacter novaezeelandiae]|uniref:Carboxy-S-adenosyl-L-methionine synthase n=1 Tax=Campylobacter novaezeelandiae TaxID=2267891 RepID=A0A4Q9JSR8_9BACT|nr:carboxy-S-adenosyl-L-methionine synthase CmoA [Campylobacter novaezeelandiae]QWU80169.1 carboxy-S-adenosyl-L-methionine synthase [Campylobacter novaezeelandiae]TBR79372.1 carboxy-S-adenosyl-L-methionine synthase CmoA [Campylobacter novaezeelandiae]TBR82142.1 carboxy-S-adenosyl-L-methionine synthase CmoA [Campylobacter novaezeelandiae]